MSQLDARTGAAKNNLSTRPGFVTVNNSQPNIMPTSSRTGSSIPGLKRKGYNSQLQVLRQGMTTGSGFTTNQLQITQNVTSLPTGRNTESCPPLQPGQAINRTQLQTQGNIPNRDQHRLTPQEMREMKVLNAMEIQALPEHRIIGISHVMVGDKEIQRISKGKINNTNEHGPGSVNDPLMGPGIDELCQTCGRLYQPCPGHFMHIELNMPVINPEQFSTLRKVLESICWSCARPYLTDVELKAKGIDRLSGINRLNAVAAESENRVCQFPAEPGKKKCSGVHYVLDGKAFKETGRILYKVKGSTSTPNELLFQRPNSNAPGTYLDDILNTVGVHHPEDLDLLGYAEGAHPGTALLTKLLVMPPCVRQAAPADGVERQDQLTDKYRKIIELNNKLGTVPKSDKNEHDKLYGALVTNIKEIYYGRDSNFQGGTVRGLAQRLGRKEGFARHNLGGKQVIYVMRSVLSPDPDLPLGWVSVPRMFASILTIPVFINTYNMDEMIALLRAGKVNEIVPVNGSNRIQVDEHRAKNYVPNIGDKFHRWLQDGDPVLFNRQPTLHKNSLVGYYARIWDNDTIGLKPSSLSGHNADFDGDEGNLHIIQSTEALLEAATKAHIHSCILSEANNIAYGAIMDNIAGAYLLSDPTIMVHPDTYMQSLGIIMGPQLANLDERLDEFKIPHLSGRALFSALLPEWFYYQKGDVRIVNGVLVQGRITKAHVGNGDRTIVKALYIADPNLAIDFLTELEAITNLYLADHPITMGLTDCLVLGEGEQQEINQTVVEALNKVNALEASLQGTSDPYQRKRIESMIKVEADIVKMIGQKLTKEKFGPENNLRIAIESGAKGSVFNVAQIGGAQSQLYVAGERPEMLRPFFSDDDNRARARGFVTGSFGGRKNEKGLVSGLDVPGVIFQSMVSREGLAGTSLKTQEVGEIHRSLRRIMEDVVRREDGSVRFGEYQIVQFDNIFNPGRLTKLPTLTDEVAGFINTPDVIGELNAKYGYYQDYNLRPRVSDDILQEKAREILAMNQ